MASLCLKRISLSLLRGPLNIMKKILLSALVAGSTFAAVPSAMAQDNAIDLGIGGFMRGYVAVHDQDDMPGNESRTFDILRDTEVHFKGKTTLDNGLTVGFHTEIRNDLGDGSAVDESYVYFSGDWGRINFGAEDGGAYLLQVAAPAADSNIDGVRQYLNPINYDTLTNGALGTGFQIDYATNSSGKSDKITYTTPKFSGLQVAASYTPDVSGTSRSLGVAEDDELDDRGSAYEIGARYEREIGDFNILLGAGYVTVDVEQKSAASDDLKSWNAAAVLGWKNFQFGAVYFDEENVDTDANENHDGFVIGADYTMGLWVLGASYLNGTYEELAANEGDTERYSLGLTYNYGPGMSFRGSVHHVEHEFGGAIGDRDATSLLLGTQINF